MVGIQGYLVRNTYRLTRDKYDAEIKTALIKASSTAAAAAFEEQLSDSVKAQAERYAADQLTKKDFLPDLNRRIAPIRRAADDYFRLFIRDTLHLSGVRYQAGYREIIVEYNGRKDTLLSGRDPRFIFTGYRAGAGHNLSLNREQERKGNFERTKEKNGTAVKESSLFVQTYITRSADAEGWLQQVIRRMAGILLLAAVLIIAVISLFYLVFRAMLRQKRLADIRTDLANNLTHELQTPLSAVGLALKSLNRPEVQQDQPLFRDLLATLQRQYEKLQGITDTVLEDAIGNNTTPVLRTTDITAFMGLCP